MRLTNPREDQPKLKKNKILFNPFSGELIIPMEVRPGVIQNVSVNTQ